MQLKVQQLPSTLLSSPSISVDSVVGPAHCGLQLQASASIGEDGCPCSLCLSHPCSSSRLADGVYTVPPYMF